MSVDEPVLRVVRGSPTAEELAVLVAVLLKAGQAEPATGRPGPSPWVRSARPGYADGRLPGWRGRDAWRAAARIR